MHFLLPYRVYHCIQIKLSTPNLMLLLLYQRKEKSFTKIHSKQTQMDVCRNEPPSTRAIKVSRTKHLTMLEPYRHTKKLIDPSSTLTRTQRPVLSSTPTVLQREAESIRTQRYEEEGEDCEDTFWTR